MKKDASSPGGTSDAQFVRRVLIFVAIVALAAALYALSDILLLVFGAILVAVVLRTIARPIQTVPGQSITAMVKGSSIGELLMNAFWWGTTIFGAAAALVVVIVAGIYIAVSPEVYRDGLVMLFPKPMQAQIVETIDDAGEALRLWLGGQLLAMIMVGVLIGVGLALVGVPSALALGLIAGVTEFVTIVGPVIAPSPHCCSPPRKARTRSPGRSRCSSSCSRSRAT
jgi:predicted PurR-regulated permease PerM